MKVIRIKFSSDYSGPRGRNDKSEYLCVKNESSGEAIALYLDGPNVFTWLCITGTYQELGDWVETVEVEKMVEIPVETTKLISPQEYFGQELSSITFK